MSKVKSAVPVGASLIALSTVFYASYGIWTKLMGDFFGGYTASALRSILVLLILTPIAIAYQKLGPINWKRDWPYLAGMVFASLFIWGPLYYAILHAGIGISLAITYASIVIGAFFFGWLFIKERFTKDKWISAFLGLIGLGLIFSPSTKSLGWLALIAALVSGFASAANMVIAKKLPYNATQSTVLLWIASVIANIPMAFLLNEAYPAIGRHIEWLYLVVFAVASVIASWSFVIGSKLIDAGAAGVLGLLEIVFGVFFGVAFFHERPGRIVMLGVAIIFTAATIPYIKDFKLKQGTLGSIK